MMDQEDLKQMRPRAIDRGLADELLDAIVDLVNQFGFRNEPLVQGDPVTFFDGGLSTLENALPLLQRFGRARRVEGKDDLWELVHVR